MGPAGKRRAVWSGGRSGLDWDAPSNRRHHNWASLDLSARTLLSAQMAALHQPLVYLSAHTHSGFRAVHRSLARQPLLELNVSSLSGWPIAYRRISFAYDAGAQRLLVRADLMAAWAAETRADTGLPTDLIKEFDLAVVKQQRESRGSLRSGCRRRSPPQRGQAAR